MAKNVSYIPAPAYWKEIVQRHSFLEAKERISINEIKIKRSLFDYNNKVSTSAVEYMRANFEADAWDPIIVTAKMFLLDGQHRLACAKKMRLKYIDVIVLSEEARRAMRPAKP